MCTGGLTPDELHNYGEYHRLSDEALAIYRGWDLKECSDAVKKPHYARAAALMAEAEKHLQLYIGGAEHG